MIIYAWLSATKGKTEWSCDVACEMWKEKPNVDEFSIGTNGKVVNKMFFSEKVKKLMFDNHFPPTKSTTFVAKFVTFATWVAII